MKIQEQLAGSWKRLRHPKWVERAGDSRAGRLLRRAGAACRANPFPAQVLLIMIYRLALDFMYVTQLSPLYAYAGFTTDLEPLRYVCSLAAMAVFVPFVAAVNEDPRPSSVLVTFLNYLYFIPLTSYCGCKGASLSLLACGAVYWAVLLALQFRLPSVELRPPAFRRSRTLFVLLTVLACLFVLYISGRYTGFRLTLDFIDVYGTRAEAAGYQIPRLFNYLLSFMTIVLSFLLLFWLRERRYLMAALVSVVFLFYYSIATRKSVFFFLFLVLGCWAFYRGWMLRWAPGFLTLGVAASWLAQEVLGIIYPMAIFVRRLMYIPVQLGEIYMDFFRENPLNLFRSGIMGKLSFAEVYSDGIPQIIGEFEGTGSNASTGLLGDLFANLPVFPGLLLMPLILAACFRLLDLSSRDIPPRLSVCFSVYFAISFMNSSWSTVLLSHGFLITCLMLYFFPKEEKLTS